MSARESWVEDSPPPLVFRPVHCHQVFHTCQGPYTRRDSLVLRQRILHSDLICNFWVNDSADGAAEGEGPGIDVEYRREAMLGAEVVHHNVRMAVGRYDLHELGYGGDVAEPKAEGWFWLGHVSNVLLAYHSVSLTYQSIKSASMIVEFDEKLYDEDSKKHEQCSPNITWVRQIDGLHCIGCMNCSDVAN